MVGSAKPCCDRASTVKLATHDAHILEPVITKALLADSVLLSPIKLQMVRPVVLADESNTRIEEIGTAQESTLRVHDGRIAERPREAGVDPGEAEQRLLGRLAATVEEWQDLSYQRNAGPRRSERDVRRELGGRHDPGCDRHIARHDTSPYVSTPSDLIEQSPASRRAREVRDNLALPRSELLLTDPVLGRGADAAVHTHDEGNRNLPTAALLGAVKESRAAPPQGRPSAHSACNRQTGSPFQDPLLDARARVPVVDVPAPADPAPSTRSRLPSRRPRQSIGVEAHRGDEVVWSRTPQHPSIVSVHRRTVADSQRSGFARQSVWGKSGSRGRLWIG
jgi:hypothetical protein